MEQYIAEEIKFENYKQLMEMLDEQCSVLENELEKAKSEITEETSPSISKEDIILNLKENWQYLDDKERFIFFQRFIKKIVINSEKIEKHNTLAEIVKIEFD